jgi:stage II sporulation protein P
LLDLHRDALDGKTKLRLSTKIANNNVAQIMLVVGTNGLGLKHDNWQDNLSFAMKIQEKANKMYPNFCRYINLRKERFNQHLSNGAILVEVGGTGNTLEECIASMKYLAIILEEVLNE